MKIKGTNWVLRNPNLHAQPNQRGGLGLFGSSWALAFSSFSLAFVDVASYHMLYMVGPLTGRGAHGPAQPVLGWAWV